MNRAGSNLGTAWSRGSGSLAWSRASSGFSYHARALSSSSRVNPFPARGLARWRPPALSRSRVRPPALSRAWPGARLFARAPNAIPRRPTRLRAAQRASAPPRRAQRCLPRCRPPTSSEWRRSRALGVQPSSSIRWTPARHPLELSYSASWFLLGGCSSAPSLLLVGRSWPLLLGCSLARWALLLGFHFQISR
uniref:Uncharacterized protein n=1 Tax=Zea mays TaxID=4577 RepID=A0A804LFF6_MAIZE